MLRVDAAGRLAEDLPCQECGYNLRGLAEEDRCPECAAPVNGSTRRDLLRFADPRWLQRLALGSRIIVIACVSIIVLDLAPAVLSAPFVNLGAETMGVLFTGYRLLRAGLTLLVVGGGWLLTTAEPASPAAERTVSVRKVARWCLVIVIAGTVLPYLGVSAVTVAARYPRSLAVLVATAAVLVHLRALVLRIPHESLARHTRIVTRGAVTCLTLSFVSSLVVTFYLLPAMRGGGSLDSAALDVLSWVGVVIGAATLAFCVLGVSVLIRSTRAFGRAAAAARGAWDDPET
jgi:hypothetical protein